MHAQEDLRNAHNEQRRLSEALREYEMSATRRFPWTHILTLYFPQIKALREYEMLAMSLSSYTMGLSYIHIISRYIIARTSYGHTGRLWSGARRSTSASACPKNAG